MNENGATKQLRQQVIDTGLCSHCGACVNLCPYYLSHNDRVVVLDECDKTEAGCLDICPKMPVDTDALKGLLFDEKDMTPEAGAIKAFYVCRAADEKTRANSQHGGTVTALMGLALKEGMIKAAVLSGKENPMLPQGVEVRSAEKAGSSGKSRFVVTPAVAKFNELVKGKTDSLGIVATPCQTLALAKMKVSKNPRIKENSKKLDLVIGLFCGWAFSSAPFKEMLSNHVDMDSITGMDIPPSQYHTLDIYTTKGTKSISLDEVVKCVRPSCQTCTDMTAEFSDISVGSARLPEGWDEAKSWNQVIVRSEAGMKLLDLARSKGILEFRDVPDGNLERLKKASLNKKKAGAENLKAPSATSSISGGEA
ncbi:MAG TPA: Coenzyme F420 hydrogenase/dehydrogenase, beta subunit C-terminal domain [Syntrophorhabdaceae bacterium]|jgi:coenzyme F420 hydrogenase subunit beta